MSAGGRERLELSPDDGHPAPAPAQALRTLRAFRGLSQRALAEAAGVHKATVSGYERGRLAIGARNLAALLAALGLSCRAWDAAVRMVRWLDHLQGGGEDGLAREAAPLAEQVSRDFEVGALAMLRLLVALAGRHADRWTDGT